MEMKGSKIGVAITGSFCTFEKVKETLRGLVSEGAKVIPIFSFHTGSMDTRFGTAEGFRKEVEHICQTKVVMTIEEAEPLGPKGMLDLLLIAPCTGNTLAKLSQGITDTPVLMAAKAHMRNNKPLVLSISTNDALGINLKNIGNLLNTKGIYFVPFGQDSCEGKPKSMIADMSLIQETMKSAWNGEQIQPLLLRETK